MSSRISFFSFIGTGSGQSGHAAVSEIFIERKIIQAFLYMAVDFKRRRTRADNLYLFSGIVYRLKNLLYILKVLKLVDKNNIPRIGQLIKHISVRQVESRQSIGLFKIEKSRLELFASGVFLKLTQKCSLSDLTRPEKD